MAALRAASDSNERKIKPNEGVEFWPVGCRLIGGCVSSRLCMGKRAHGLYPRMRVTRKGFLASGQVYRRSILALWVVKRARPAAPGRSRNQRMPLGRSTGPSQSRPALVNLSPNIHDWPDTALHVTPLHIACIGPDKPIVKSVGQPAGQNFRAVETRSTTEA